MTSLWYLNGARKSQVSRAIIVDLELWRDNRVVLLRLHGSLAADERSSVEIDDDDVTLSSASRCRRSVGFSSCSRRRLCRRLAVPSVGLTIFLTVVVTHIDRRPTVRRLRLYNAVIVIDRHRRRRPVARTSPVAILRQNQLAAPPVTRRIRCSIVYVLLVSRRRCWIRLRCWRR